MTAGPTNMRQEAFAPSRAPLSAWRLLWLHLTGRRVPAALAAVLACAVALRIALHWQWDAYGALQLPLIVETGCAVAIVVTTASPFGDPERATGRWLPYLRLAAALALTAVATGALVVAGIGASLAGGPAEVVRNVAGLTGVGLLCAAVLGASLAWAGPTAYMVVGVYGLYTQWHGPALTSPWIWPARPPHDAGAAICAGLVFVAGMVAITVRGARDPVGE
jgi:hypothetical protein